LIAPRRKHSALSGRSEPANPIITIDGDPAHVDSDWLWLDPNFALARAGRYSDDLRRINGRWMFTVRGISMVFDAAASV